MRKLIINRKKLRRIAPTKNPFLSLTRSIIYQQISTAAGNSIYKRFLTLFKGRVTSERLLNISDADLRSAGISPQKLTYLRDLAEKFQNKTINTKNFHKMSDLEIKDHLVQVKGIGPWTADMFLIFALNRPDILPVGDLAIIKGFQRVFKLKKLPTERQMRRLAEPYKGEHTYLSLYLWDSLDG